MSRLEEIHKAACQLTISRKNAAATIAEAKTAPSLRTARLYPRCDGPGGLPVYSNDGCSEFDGTPWKNSEQQEKG